MPYEEGGLRNCLRPDATYDGGAPVFRQGPWRVSPMGCTSSCGGELHIRFYWELAILCSYYTSLSTPQDYLMLLWSGNRKLLQRLPIQTIAGCESDTTLRTQFGACNPSPRSFCDMRKMVTTIKNDRNVRKYLYKPDILSVTAPCQGRTVLLRENNIPSDRQHPDNDLFLLQCEIASLLGPRLIIAEMVPPNSDHSEDHRLVVEELDKLGCDVQTTDSFQADLCGDFQARERWIAIARDIDHHAPIYHDCEYKSSKYILRATVPMHFDTFYTTHSSPVSAILDPVNQVPRQCWIHEKFIRVFDNPTKYADSPVEPVKFPYCGGTSLTIREDAELAMLIERALNEHSIASNKTLLILGTDLKGRSHKVLGTSSVCKIWSIIYNIIQRCKLCSHHDTFVIETAGDGSGLYTALALRHKVKSKSVLSSNLATFSVGQYSGGELATGSVYGCM